MRAPRQTAWLDQYLVVRLMGAGMVARRELARALRRQRAPLREVAVVAVVTDHPRISPTAVADRLALQRSELSRMLPELVEDGLLEWPHERLDGRGWALTAGAAAPAFLARAAPALESVERGLRRRLTRTRCGQLEICLEALRGPRSPVFEVLEELG